MASAGWPRRSSPLTSRSASSSSRRMWRSSLFEEHRKGYTDSLAVRIPGQTVSLGRFTFGPKVWTTYRAADGTMLAPYLAVKGIWDCDPARLIDNETGAASGSDRLRGRPQRAVAVGPVADGGRRLRRHRRQRLRGLRRQCHAGDPAAAAGPVAAGLRPAGHYPAGGCLTVPAGPILGTSQSAVGRAGITARRRLKGSAL